MILNVATVIWIVVRAAAGVLLGQALGAAVRR